MCIRDSIAPPFTKGEPFFCLTFSLPFKGGAGGDWQAYGAAPGIRLDIIKPDAAILLQERLGDGELAFLLIDGAPGKPCLLYTSRCV